MTQNPGFRTFTSTHIRTSSSQYHPSVVAKPYPFQDTMVHLIAAFGLVSTVAAFPSMINERSPDTAAKMSEILRRQLDLQDPLGISQSQTNCGFSGPCLTFDESQEVSTSGENQFIAPGPGDIRGPCPGLYVLFPVIPLFSYGTGH